jgi:epoxyqueuosine reductase
MDAEAGIKTAAKESGFELCGIASLSAPPAHLQALLPWLEKGQHGTMAWMERQASKRLDPTKIMPGAKSLICVGLVYNTDHPYSTDIFPMDGRTQTRNSDTQDQAWISRYAWGEDYHRVMERKLQALRKALQALHPGAAFRAYADTGPISEKAWAAQAGLGWQGKHTNVINQDLGSWFFLGELLTDLELQPDAPAKDLCGSCTRCIDACPTQALTSYRLDATRCLSYLSIEVKGDLPQHLGSALGANVYGCDICQDVCPWNRGRVLAQETAFEPGPGLVAPALADLAGMDDDSFNLRFQHSAVRRTKASGLRRNIKAARPKTEPS